MIEQQWILMIRSILTYNTTRAATSASFLSWGGGHSLTQEGVLTTPVFDDLTIDMKIPSHNNYASATFLYRLICCLSFESKSFYSRMTMSRSCQPLTFCIWQLLYRNKLALAGGLKETNRSFYPPVSVQWRRWIHLTSSLSSSTDYNTMEQHLMDTHSPDKIIYTSTIWWHMNRRRNHREASSHCARQEQGSARPQRYPGKQDKQICLMTLLKLQKSNLRHHNIILSTLRTHEWGQLHSFGLVIKKNNRWLFESRI